MAWLYNLLIKGYGTAIKAASLRNVKAQKWVEGRQNWPPKLKALLPSHPKRIWFHAASLGEAEQGLPVIQKLKKAYPDHFILLTFFSPSGYEHFPPHPAVDATFYLPLDTPENARQWVTLLQPEVVVFIKYEIWLNYFKALTEADIPTLIAPALFRPGQFYFKAPFRAVFLPVLKKLYRIMVQTEQSAHFLQQQEFNNVVVCGDTRVDRVLEIVNTPYEDPLAEAFSSGHTVLVVGSSWPQEEKLLAEALPHFPDLKVILAPHDVGEAHIGEILQRYGPENCERYSSGKLQGNRQLLIIDTIGKLSRLYRYGDMAWIGGGMGKGVHSTLEAAAYGMPVFFGPKHQSFVEPGLMLKQGVAFEIRDLKQLIASICNLISDQNLLADLSAKIRAFTRSRAGATEQIFEVVSKTLKA